MAVPPGADASGSRGALLKIAGLFVLSLRIRFSETAMLRRIALFVVLLPLVFAVRPALGAEQIVILPPAPQLTGPQATQQLVAERMDGELFLGEVPSGAKWTSLAPEIVAVDGRGRLTPKGEGVATIRVETGGQAAETSVTVKGLATAEPRSFRHDVQSVLTRAGCNMGACHGAQAGKKGFKLTLRGYDHERDYLTITRQARGRRIASGDAAESLLLQKAVGEIPHAGGVRFTTDSLEYRILHDWVAQGAPAPSAGDSHVVSIDVFPKAVRLTPNATQQLLVEAVYSDGRRRDVTHWAKYTSTEIGVATIDDEGRVSVVGQGEAALTVWFASKVTIATVSVPSPTPVSPERFANSPRQNFIDEHVLAKLESLGLPPSPQCDDATFIRRATLDTRGLLPSPEEVQAFLVDSNPRKRELLIDALVARPEAVDYWAYKWADVLLVSSKKLKGPAVWAFSEWVRKAVRENMPWDQFARAVVTASGSALENGAANYFVLHKDPKLVMEATTVTFLGFSINCAQCHDHPLERWTQDDYFGMANLFARVRLKDGPVDGEFVVTSALDVDLRHPNRTAVPVPRPLDGQPLDGAQVGDRRGHFADWLTAPENPYFARAAVNRVWANYMGRGLVETVDDMRFTNPASNAPLLAALSADFVAHGYDLRHLMRTIMRSAAYQRSALILPENAADDRFYSHYLIKRLSAEVLLDSYSQVTGIATEFPDYPKGLRALQLPDTNVVSYFLSAFGRPVREFTCDCERTEEPSVTQTLHLANGKTLNDKLKAAGGRIDRWMADKLTDEQIVTELYLATLSRAPSANEKQAVLDAVRQSIAEVDAALVLPKASPAGKSEAADAKAQDAKAQEVIRSLDALFEDKLARAATPAERQALMAVLGESLRNAARRQTYEDVVWAVLTSKEFLFVH
jgi:hypothetical protein